MASLVPAGTPSSVWHPRRRLLPAWLDPLGSPGGSRGGPEGVEGARAAAQSPAKRARARGASREARSCSGRIKADGAILTSGSSPVRYVRSSVTWCRVSGLRASGALELDGTCAAPSSVLGCQGPVPSFSTVSLPVSKAPTGWGLDSSISPQGDSGSRGFRV
eukprot:347380-Prorocentrum_minimum.AAC.1